MCLHAVNEQTRRVRSPPTLYVNRLSSQETLSKPFPPSLPAEGKITVAEVGITVVCTKITQRTAVSVSSRGPAPPPLLWMSRGICSVSRFI